MIQNQYFIDSKWGIIVYLLLIHVIYIVIVYASLLSQASVLPIR